MWSVSNKMYHNVFRYEYLTFQAKIPLHKQYIFDTNNIQSEYPFLFPFSICVSLPKTKENAKRVKMFTSKWHRKQ